MQISLKFIEYFSLLLFHKKEINLNEKIINIFKHENYIEKKFFFFLQFLWSKKVVSTETEMMNEYYFYKHLSTFLLSKCIINKKTQIFLDRTWQELGQLCYRSEEVSWKCFLFWLFEHLIVLSFLSLKNELQDHFHFLVYTSFDWLIFECSGGGGEASI